ncbi:MAG: CBS domain-containing protein [Nitriliruptorales bacterium]|nr:CBS domain-containing protein [Nitriliruptorales bacterium]
MTTVREKMTKHLVILDGSTNLFGAAEAMRDEDIGDVLLDLDGTYGIVTDRDIVVRALAEGKNPTDTTLEDIATTDLETVQADDDLDEVIRDMAERDIRRIPVMESDDLVGILSLGDLAMMRDEDSVLADISAAPANN